MKYGCKMSKRFLAADHHIDHVNSIKFRSEFSSIEELNEIMVERHNSVVRKKDDIVYFLGDVMWKAESIEHLKRMNGRKKLIMGNHDTFPASLYSEVFETVVGVSDLQIRKPKRIKAVLSHMPVHTQQLEHRFQICIHGHLHSYKLDDPRYICVSMEHINYTPIDVDDAIRPYLESLK